MRSTLLAQATRTTIARQRALAAAAVHPSTLRSVAHTLITRSNAPAASMSSAAANQSAASSSSAQVAPVASPSAPPSSLASAAHAIDYSDPTVRHLAVYGTLRDDDDSGAVWTAEFLRGLTSARGGTVRGARLYWSDQGSWPFAMVHERSSARFAADPAPSSADGAAICEHESDLLHVRLLQFESSSDSFATKIAAADVIEGFSPARPDSHEYVRRKIWVDVDDGPVPAAAAAVAAQSSSPSSSPQQPQPQPQQHKKRQRIAAWIYIKEHGLTDEVLAGHERMEHGDWMKRDRNRKRNN